MFPAHAIRAHRIFGGWRQIVTIFDAQAKGCDLFDIAQLRNERPEHVFRMLFMCQFGEQGDSVFSLADLLDCGVDSNVVWVDFKTKEKRPYGNLPVWAGYDPARVGDKSIFAIVGF